VVRGEAPLSFSNFVAGFDWPASRAEEWLDGLIESVSGRHECWFFVDSEDRPRDMEGRLRSRGAVVRQTLVHMSAIGPAGPAGPLVQVTGLDRRLKVATMMAEEFFASSPLSVRRTVALATARSPHDLLVLAERGETVGAVMVSRTSRSLGLYNLYVPPDRRGRGFGSLVVSSALRTAREEGRVPVLQCDRGLVPWYFRLGFEETGELRALTLPKGPI
jgi:ribosomal protein S18 acetylase RimI-like enzyme